MKKIFLLLSFVLLSVVGFSQGYQTGGIFLRVTDSATYVNSAYVTTSHANNYAEIWYSTASDLFWKWNGATSTYEQLGSGSGGNFIASDGPTTVTNDLDIDANTDGGQSIFWGANNYFDIMSLYANTFDFNGTGGGSIGIDGNDVTLGAGTGRLLLEFDSLLVNGDIGSLNEVLTTDGTGEASWQPVPGVVGAQDLFISAAAMWPRATSGCSVLTRHEIATSLANIQSLDFDQSSDEYAQIQLAFPRNWNNGTVTVTVYWTAASGSGTVQWEVNAAAYSNDDALTGTLGTAVVIDDTLIATDDLHVTPTSSALTIAGTPADADFLVLQIMRDVSDDTLSGDAKFLGMRITLTTDSGTSE